MIPISQLKKLYLADSAFYFESLASEDQVLRLGFDQKLEELATPEWLSGLPACKIHGILGTVSLHTGKLFPVPRVII